MLIVFFFEIFVFYDLILEDDAILDCSSKSSINELLSGSDTSAFSFDPFDD
jgi:hypothetical protein